MKTGSFEIQSGNKPEVTVRVSWEETFDSSTEKSTFSVTNVEMKNSSWYGLNNWFNGYIKVGEEGDEKELVAFSSTGGTHGVYTSALNTYCPVHSDDDELMPPWSTQISNTNGKCSIVVNITGYQTDSSGDYYGASQGWNVTTTKELSITEVCTVTYKNPDGTDYATKLVAEGSTHTVSSSGPSKSDTTTVVTVSFNENGGNNPSKSTEEATNKTSYSFNGWNTAANGSGTAHAKGASITVDSALTLHPTYASSVSYGKLTAATVTKNNSETTATVTFDANGGSCDTTSLTSTKTDTYSCKGWYTKASAGTKLANSGGEMTPKTTQTVYAQWTTTSGTYSSVSLPTATRVGYKHLGWATSPTAIGGTTGSYTPTGNLTLYAIWEAQGRVYIDNGTTFEPYSIWIDNGSGWDQYMAYVDNGSGWDPCG